MKRKEKAHLRQDPFVAFFEKIVHLFKSYKREILLTAVIMLALIVLIGGIIFTKSCQSSKENRVFSEALQIRNSETLTIDEKISKISHLPGSRGLSAANTLYLASLYFKKGDYSRSRELLKNSRSSNIQLLEDQKKMLEADCLAALGKPTESLDILNILLGDPKSEVTKDLLLLKIAKIQLKNRQPAEAVASLKRILSDFPNSFFAGEAREILNTLEEPIEPQE